MCYACQWNINVHKNKEDMDINREYKPEQVE